MNEDSGPRPKSGCCCENEDRTALAFKALGHPVRLSIVMWLAGRNACCCGEVCAELPLAQSTVSQHLDLLVKAGLVKFRQEGTRSRYSLESAAFEALAAILSRLGEAEIAQESA